MPLMAIAALFYGVVERKTVPVFFLAGCHDSRSLAKRAGGAQGGSNCGADKLGAIRNRPQRLSQRLINLESNDFRLMFSHAGIITLYYLICQVVLW